MDADADANADVHRKKPRQERAVAHTQVSSAPSLRGPRSAFHADQCPGKSSLSRGPPAREGPAQSAATAPVHCPCYSGCNVTLLDSDRDFSRYTGFRALCGPEWRAKNVIRASYFLSAVLDLARALLSRIEINPSYVCIK